jgi:hypothetical protein
MVRLREFFSGEETAMARTLRGQSMKASDEQRREETERHTASPRSVAANKKTQARERLGRIA